MKLPEFLIQQMSLGNKVRWYLMITEREMAKQNNGFKIKGSMNIWKQKGKDEGGESKLLGGRGSTPSKSSQEAKKKKNSARDQSNTGITSIKSSRHLSILTPWKIWVLCIWGFFPSLKIFTKTWKLHLHLLLIL